MSKARIPPSNTAGCIPWTGKKHGYGYGMISRKGERYLVHRVAWERANGPIPAGLHVLHHCDNPPCYRPSHLFVGDQRDNLLDAFAKGRHRPLPRMAGEQHGRAILKESQVKEIRTRLTSGERAVSLAAEYGVSQPLIYAIRKRIIWRDVE